MEVINKRRKSKDEDWNVGDVVRYYDRYDDGKPNFGLIVGSANNNKYYLAFLNSDTAERIKSNVLGSFI